MSFAAITVQGYTAGFPVLLPTQLSRATSAAALQYLLDGNYLDKQSEQLTAELLTYNADLRVMGYAHMTFAWQRDGSISGVTASTGIGPCSSLGGTHAVSCSRTNVVSFVRWLVLPALPMTRDPAVGEGG
jgi:hypothetical protein